MLERGDVELIGSNSVAWLGVPLQRSGKTFGVLVVQSYDPRFRYDEADRDLLSFVSQHIAVALERRRAQDAIRESEERYRLLFERNFAGVYRMTLIGRILECNDALARIFGYGSREELVDRDMAVLYPDAEAAPAILRRAVARPEPLELRDAGRAQGRRGGLDVPERGPARGRARGRGHRRGHRRRRHRAATARGAAAPVPEDGGHRPARGRHRPRLQQPPDDGPRLQRHGPLPALAARSDPRGHRRDPPRRRARVEPDAPAPRLQPQAGLRAARAGPERPARRLGPHARAADRRAHPLRDEARALARQRQGRPGPARTGHRQPRRQRPRRHAGRRNADRSDRERRRGRRVVAPPLRHRARPLRRDDRVGHGRRHRPRDPEAHLRALLHDEGDAARNRPRSRHRLRHREPERRSDLRRQRARTRRDLRDLPPAGRRARGRGGGGGRLAGSIAARRRSSSSRTRTPSAA